MYIKILCFLRNSRLVEITILNNRIEFFSRFTLQYAFKPLFFWNPDCNMISETRENHSLWYFTVIFKRSTQLIIPEWHHVSLVSISLLLKQTHPTATQWSCFWEHFMQSVHFLSVRIFWDGNICSDFSTEIFSETSFSAAFIDCSTIVCWILDIACNSAWLIFSIDWASCRLIISSLFGKSSTLGHELGWISSWTVWRLTTYHSDMFWQYTEQCLKSDVKKRNPISTFSKFHFHKTPHFIVVT